jgi:hypothetical protein
LLGCGLLKGTGIFYLFNLLGEKYAHNQSKKRRSNQK